MIHATAKMPATIKGHSMIRPLRFDKNCLEHFDHERLRSAFDDFSWLEPEHAPAVETGQVLLFHVADDVGRHGVRSAESASARDPDTAFLLDRDFMRGPGPIKPEAPVRQEFVFGRRRWQSKEHPPVDRRFYFPHGRSITYLQNSQSYPLAGSDPARHANA